jgi:hypothetical protein
MIVALLLAGFGIAIALAFSLIGLLGSCIYYAHGTTASAAIRPLVRPLAPLPS